MYALVEIAGTQVEVHQNDIIRVPFLDKNIGETVTFDKLLLGSANGDDLNIGKPYISGTVSAKVLAHGRFDKVIVFKKIRRKGYRKLNGHKQDYSKIEITGINL